MIIKRFNRYELKYVIHARSYRRLMADLKHFMEPDRHAGESGFYRVVSLYYDSPGLHAYWSKLDGLKFRRKLRLRIYPYPDLQSVKTGFVEIKQRIDRTVQKRRVVLPLAEAEQVCSGEPVLSELDETDSATVSEVNYMVRALRLRPPCVVSYRRQAFVGGRFEQGMRLTFDAQLQGRVHALTVNELARNRYFLPPDWLVMEVKVNERVPNWVVSLLAKHECRLQRVSKYCAVVSRGLHHRQRAMALKENLYG